MDDAKQETRYDDLNAIKNRTVASEGVAYTSATPDSPLIWAAFENVDKQLELLADEVARLLNRIEPVLGPDVPHDETTLAQAKPMASHAASRLFDIADRAAAITVRLQFAHQRIEI